MTNSDEMTMKNCADGFCGLCCECLSFHLDSVQESLRQRTAERDALQARVETLEAENERLKSDLECLVMGHGESQTQNATLQLQLTAAREALVRLAEEGQRLILDLAEDEIEYPHFRHAVSEAREALLDGQKGKNDDE